MNRPRLAPEYLDCLKQIVCPFFPAVVREVTDDESVFRKVPPPPRLGTVAAGAFSWFDAEALQDDLGGRDAERDCEVAFARRLHENSVRLIEQPDEGRRRVAAPDPVLGVVGVAKVQERRDQKGNAESPRQPARTYDWKGVRKRRCMDGIERPAHRP